MKVFAVLDTNVLVSAFLKSESVPGIVVREALEGKIIPLINEDILEEYEAVLKRKKFKINAYDVDRFLKDFGKRAISLKGYKSDEAFVDESDVVFFEVVMEAREEEDAYLVTGNIKHFPVCSYVVTPRQMLDILSM